MNQVMQEIFKECLVNHNRREIINTFEGIKRENWKGVGCTWCSNCNAARDTLICPICGQHLYPEFWYEVPELRSKIQEFRERDRLDELRYPGVR
jgi:hypothetical protein